MKRLAVYTTSVSTGGDSARARALLQLQSSVITREEKEAAGNVVRRHLKHDPAAVEVILDALGLAS